MIPWRPLLDRVAPWRDPALAAALAALGEFELWSGATYDADPVWPGPRVVNALLILALTAPLAWRRRRPTATCAVLLVLLALSCAVLGGGEATTEFLLFIVTVFTAAAYARRPVLLGVAALVVGAIHELRDQDVRGPGDVVWAAGMLSVAWLVGLAVRTRIVRIGSLESRAATAQHEHDRRVAEATAAERAAIARELHDIVSHAVAVVVIQAQVGQRALPDDVAHAGQALETIERTGRDALAELRRLLTLLSGQETTTLEPAASLRRLDELVAGYRTAGLDVQVDADVLPVLPPATDLTAYRLVQEALTNVMRHSPGATARVTVRHRTGVVEVQVDNGAALPGVRVPRQPEGTGRGLIGMLERLRLIGGQLLHAGPYDDGYRVLARIPVVNLDAARDACAAPERIG